MGKQFETSQREILNAIEQTVTLWETLQKEQLIKGTVTCSLCLLIKNVYRVSFHKGSARGACLLCPVKHAGLFHICVGIQHVYSTPDMTNEEMKSLRTTVISNLKDLDKQINITEHYDNYISHVISTRKQLVSEQTPIKNAKSNKNEKTKPKRIFKVTK